jgi:Flp pilus assembly protein TadB
MYELHYYFVVLCLVSGVVFYFLYWRPKKRREQEEQARRHQELLRKLTSKAKPNRESQSQVKSNPSANVCLLFGLVLICFIIKTNPQSI